MTTPAPAPQLLYPDATEWHYVTTDASGERVHEILDVDVEFAPAQTVEQLLERVPDLDTVIILLRSQRCLAASIATNELERGQRRKALAFRLEEHLPIAAEQVVVDFIETQDHALGVCTDLETLQPVVRAFEQLGIQIPHILPEAMLLAAALHKQQNTLDAIAVTHPDESQRAVDLIELSTGKPIHWHWYPELGDDLVDHLASLASAESGPPSLALVTPDAEDLARFEPHTQSLHHIDQPRDELLRDAARDLLEGRLTPWFDLRRDRLAPPDRFETYRGSAILLAAAAIFCLACIITLTQWWGAQYRSIADDLVAEQVTVFKEAFPDQRVPVNIVARLRSESRKLAGISGNDVSDPSLLRPPSALTILHRFLTALPRDQRFRVTELSIEADTFRVDGEARSHAEAERIAQTVRASDHFETDPPRTQTKDEQSVTYLFEGTPTPRSTP
ncbi:hypothetical protein [Mucisphaera calidilacus]|uniref:GspL periplasmic domain protein n=1 Tax=Mucisphaera calidilacus TaxID=2527982 RepID=A0A518BUL0_9BACT|nr:hypothetical protein [Mucisphaera calidilacus]QDU70614.1 GspL periplasmic domain protein [Mucisphaera calidilacus]